MDPSMQQQPQYYYAPGAALQPGYYSTGAGDSAPSGYVLPMSLPQQMMYYAPAPHGACPAPGYAYAAPMYYQPPEAAFAAMSLSGQTKQTPGASSTTSHGSQPRASSPPIPGEEPSMDRMMSADPDAIPENLDHFSPISHQSSPDSFMDAPGQYPQRHHSTTPVSSMPRPFWIPPTNQNLMPSNYKTRLCTQWLDKRDCSMGAQCKFAHGNAELRHPERMPQYYPMPGGGCEFGAQMKPMMYQDPYPPNRRQAPSALNVAFLGDDAALPPRGDAPPSQMRRGFAGGSMYNLASGTYTDNHHHSDEYRTRQARVDPALNVAFLGDPGYGNGAGGCGGGGYRGDRDRARYGAARAKFNRRAATNQLNTVFCTGDRE